MHLCRRDLYLTRHLRIQWKDKEELLRIGAHKLLTPSMACPTPTPCPESHCYDRSATACLKLLLPAFLTRFYTLQKLTPLLCWLAHHLCLWLPNLNNLGSSSLSTFSSLSEIFQLYLFLRDPCRIDRCRDIEGICSSFYRPTLWRELFLGRAYYMEADVHWHLFWQFRLIWFIDDEVDR